MDIQKFINQDLGVEMRSYIENNNVYLNAEDVCRGLGFVMIQDQEVATSGNLTKLQHKEGIRWSRVNKYLEEMKVLTGEFKNGVQIPYTLNKDTYMPEQIFYLLAMKSNSEAAKKFQVWLAFDVIPQIRTNGMYVDTNHKTVRQLGKFIRDMEESAIYALHSYARKQGYHITTDEIFSLITNATQKICEIPTKGRDKASVEQLVRLVKCECAVTATIYRGILHEKSFMDIFSFITNCKRWIKEDGSFLKFDELKKIHEPYMFAKDAVIVSLPGMFNNVTVSKDKIKVDLFGEVYEIPVIA